MTIFTNPADVGQLRPPLGGDPLSPIESADSNELETPNTQKTKTNPIADLTDYDIETSSHKAASGGPSIYGGSGAASTTPQKEDPPME